jgi:hypothetical protein
MDLTSILKSEILRPLSVLFLPGSIAISPFVFITLAYNPKLQIWVNGNTNLFIFILILIALAVGHMLEDVGSFIERRLDDLLDKKSTNHLEKRWYPYLKLKINEEYVGQRYLRTILVRMKFELSMVPALMVFLIGFLWLNARLGFWGQCPTALLVILIAGLIAFLIMEAYKSLFTLDETRMLLISAVGGRKLLKRYWRPRSRQCQRNS